MMAVRVSLFIICLFTLTYLLTYHQSSLTLPPTDIFFWSICDCLYDKICTNILLDIRSSQKKLQLQKKKIKSPEGGFVGSRLTVHVIVIIFQN